MVDMQHFSRWTFPKYPTCYYHEMDNHLHKRGLQQTILSVLLLGLTHNGLESPIWVVSLPKIPCSTCKIKWDQDTILQQAIYIQFVYMLSSKRVLEMRTLENYQQVVSQIKPTWRRCIEEIIFSSKHLKQTPSKRNTCEAESIRDIRANSWRSCKRKLSSCVSNSNLIVVLCVKLQ